jgi:hypothetical protein
LEFIFDPRGILKAAKMRVPVNSVNSQRLKRARVVSAVSADKAGRLQRRDLSALKDIARYSTY